MPWPLDCSRDCRAWSQFKIERVLLRTKNERSTGLRGVRRNDLRPFSPKIFLAIGARRLWTFSLRGNICMATFACNICVATFAWQHLRGNICVATFAWQHLRGNIGNICVATFGAARWQQYCVATRGNVSVARSIPVATVLAASFLLRRSAARVFVVASSSRRRRVVVASSSRRRRVVVVLTGILTPIPHRPDHTTSAGRRLVLPRLDSSPVSSPVSSPPAVLTTRSSHHPRRSSPCRRRPFPPLSLPVSSPASSPVSPAVLTTRAGCREPGFGVQELHFPRFPRFPCCSEFTFEPCPSSPLFVSRSFIFPRFPCWLFGPSQHPPWKPWKSWKWWK